MRKMLFMALAPCLLLLASCTSSEKPGYVIAGTAEGTVDGDTVYLCDMQGFFSMIPTDTAVVKEGKFEFAGEYPGAAIRYVVPVHAGSAQGLGMAQVILENANIDVQIFKRDSVNTQEPIVASDGENAQFYKEYEAMQKEWNDKINPYWDIVREKKGTEEEIAAAQAEMDKISPLRDEASYNFVVEHIPAAISDMLLPYIWRDLEDAKKDTLLAKFAEQCPDMPNYKAIAAQIEAEKNTAVGALYTDIVMPDPDGNTIKVSDYVAKNKYTLVDFWASWCGPCLGEMPNVVEAYKKYHDKGFEVVGVSLDNSKEAWVKSIEAQKLPWPQMSDIKGWECQGAKDYNVRAIPANVLIDQSGKIVAKDLREEALQEKLAELFK